MIVAEGLTKYYGPKLALVDVSLRVGRGEILGLLGPNGAGKTTMMRVLAGYLPPTAGRAEIAGYDITRQALEARRRIGYLPETVPLYPELTVRAYLDFQARLKGVPARRRRERIATVAERTGAADVIDTLIGKLSRGYRQRVGLAQALVHDPPVLILDEPTVGLDPRQIIETRQLIKGLAGEHSVMLSTHILPEVAMTCQRVAIISDGRVVAEDTPDNLTRRLRGADIVELEIRGPQQDVAAALRGLAGVRQVESQSRDGRLRLRVECELGQDLREQLAATVVGRGWGLLELRPVGMSLEEIFLQLTTKEEELSETA
ncbi:MAG: ABC transporter ATP-binding protein [Chloroflexi bacterium]|nr:ABC transporter ATP-binding protein [Chloroflexota bacterium]MBI4506715.1 ABC transporter ATP-binding protein [Chloroflexota bacterium]